MLSIDPVCQYLRIPSIVPVRQPRMKIHTGKEKRQTSISSTGLACHIGGILEPNEVMNLSHLVFKINYLVIIT